MYGPDPNPNELFVSPATPYPPDVGWPSGPADIITPNAGSNGIPGVGGSSDIIDIEAVGLSIDASLISQSAESQTLSDGTGSSLPSPQILQQALQVAQNDFNGLANDPDFANKMQLPFGNSFDLEEARVIIQEFAQGDFSSVPPVNILPRAAINGANGAFDSLNNLIYVSSEFIAENTANPEAVARLLIEEIGHYIDSEINTSDSQGDEGEIFAAAVLDVNLDEPELLALKAEDDRATIVLDGKVIEIEQDNSPGTARDLGTLSGTQTFNDFIGDSDPRDYYRFNLSGNSDFSLSMRSLLDRAYGFQMFQDTNNNGLADPGEPTQNYSHDNSQDDILDITVTGGSLGLSVIGNNSILSMSGPLSAGTYYVQVYENGDNSDYTLSLSAIEDTSPIPTSDGAGNSLSAARNIGTLSSTRNFSDFVGTSDRDDYYRFRLSNNSNVSLTLNGLSADADLQLIRDTNNNGRIDFGEVLRTSSINGTAADSINRSLNAGTYFVRVYPSFGSANTNYTLNLSAIEGTSPIPSSDGAGNRLSRARNIGTLSGTQNFSDFVGTSDRNDYYRFSLSNNSGVSLSLNVSFSLSNLRPNADMWLIRDTNNNGRINRGEVLQTSRRDGTAPDSIIASLNAGTYYVRVYPRSGDTNYSLSLSDVSFPIITIPTSIPPITVPTRTFP